MKGERSLRRPLSASSLWLIAKNDNNGRLGVLTIDRGGEETLPVFSFREEAELFCRFATWEGDWQVRESAAGELVSVLYGPCASVGSVALDPLPEMVAEKTVGLVSLSRERFIAHIMSRERLPASVVWISSRDPEEASEAGGVIRDVSLSPPRRVPEGG